MLLCLFQYKTSLRHVSGLSTILSLCSLPIPWELGEGNVHRHILKIGKSTLALCVQQGILLPGMEPAVLTHFLVGYFPFDFGLRQDV